MPLEPLSPAAFAFIAQVEQVYARLMQLAAGRGETSAGGQLLYAGELDQAGRAAAAAANIAGAATLAASAGQAARKQAMRDGVVDFLVTSLDEALRTLKNQVRKREAVAVCVGAAAEAVEREMQERGVEPDLILARAASESAGQSPRAPLVTSRATGRIAARIDPTEADAETAPATWLTWRAAEAPALWLPKLDAIAIDCLALDDPVSRRWIERAPRYLGRLEQNARTLRTTEPLAQQLIAQLEQRIRNGEISVPIEIEQGPWGNSHNQTLTPTQLH